MTSVKAVDGRTQLDVKFDRFSDGLRSNNETNQIGAMRMNRLKFIDRMSQERISAPRCHALSCARSVSA